MEKPGLGLTADMATQYPPLELGRMLSGNPGRLSMKFSIPPLFRPATWTLAEEGPVKRGRGWGNLTHTHLQSAVPADAGHGGLGDQD